MTTPPPDAGATSTPRRRRLRAVFAADVANYGGLVSIDETNTLDGLTLIRRFAIETLHQHGGWLFGLPGDGIFALFESAVDAVRCGLDLQARLAEVAQLDHLKLRIGIHLGEVVFENEMPFGEALVVAARLESLAEPGGVLVSSSVRDAVVLRIHARFEDLGVRPLKHSPRTIGTFGVFPADAAAGAPLSDTITDVPPADLPLPLPETPAAAAASESDPVGVRMPEPSTVQIEPPRLRRDPKDRSILPSLPRAQPFVIPGAELDETNGLSRPTPAIADAVPEMQPPARPAGPLRSVQACMPELIAALAVHLGPLARVLAQRAAAEAASPMDLAEKLAAEVKNEAERRQFLAGARLLIQRHVS